MKILFQMNSLTSVIEGSSQGGIIKSFCPYQKYIDIHHGNLVWLYKYVHTYMHIWEHAFDKAVHVCQEDEWIWNLVLLHLSTRKVLTTKCTRLKYKAENNKNISSPWLQVQILSYLWHNTIYSANCLKNLDVGGGGKYTRKPGMMLFWKIRAGSRVRWASD